MGLDRIFGGSLFLAFLIMVCLGIGWVMNCYKFTQLDFQRPIRAEILRGIGIIPPIGAVLGWIHINDTPSKNEPPVAKNRPPVAMFEVTPEN